MVESMPGLKYLVKSGISRNGTQHLGLISRVVGCRGGSRYIAGSWGFSTWKAYWFLGLWFLGSNFSKIYQSFISCFLKDTGPISKIFKILLGGSAGLFGARLFEKCQTFGVPLA